MEHDMDMEKRLEEVTQGLHDLGQRVDGLGQQVTVLGQRVDGLGQQVNGLSQRVDGLDHRLINVEQDVAVIKSNYATKADVLEAKNSTLMWVISAVFLAQILPLLLKKLGL